MAEAVAAESLLLARTRAFAQQQAAPQAARLLREQGSCLSVLPEAARAGLLGLQVPVDQGGLGLSLSCKVQAADILAEVDFGLAMAVINTHNVAEQLARLSPQGLALQHLPRLLAGATSACTALTEPGAGSDFAAVQTTAVQVSGGWRLDGAKAWIINAIDASLVVVYAQTAPGSGAAGIAAFVVDAHSPGFHRTGSGPMGPVPTLGTGAFSLQDYRCRDDDLLSPPGRAFKDILVAINGARTYVAAMCCGMVSECLRVASSYGLQRQTFGKALHDHQGWRWQLADAAIDLDAARLMVVQAAALIDAGGDAQGAAARAKVFATRMAHRHIAALLHAMGAEGLRDEYPFTRHLQAAQVAALTDGSTGMLLERIARDVRQHKAI